MDIESEVKILLKDILNINLKFIDCNDSLSDKFGMNSITFVKFIINLEDKFDIEIPDEYFVISELNSIYKIKELVTKLLTIKQRT